MDPFRLGALRDAESFRAPLTLTVDDIAKAWELLRLMKLVRLVEQRIAMMVETGEARCPCHLAIGQEAAAVGVCRALMTTDAVFGAHRSHGHFLALGGSPLGLLAEILGREAGCSAGFGGSMHLRSVQHGLVGTVPIVAATIPIAVGAGLALLRSRRPNVAVAFFGDGAVEEGVFHESLNLASSMGIPVIFVVENNLFASHMHVDDRQPFDRIARFAEAHGVESATMDGNDVLGVHSAATEIVESRRRQPSPYLLELVTYRWLGHVGHREDIDVGVARSGDLPGWRERDPIRRLERALETLTDDAPAQISELNRALGAEVESALDEARRSAFPDAGRLLGTVMFESESG